MILARNNHDDTPASSATLSAYSGPITPPLIAVRADALCAMRAWLLQRECDALIGW